jgi:hypothetical protein
VPEVTDAFYLAGGTGLALHLGHRISVDFDWFSESNPLRDADRARVLDSLRGSGHEVAILQDENGTLSVAWQRVVVSFFAYGTPLLERPVVIGGLPVASVSDIAAMKLAAVVGRGAKKDFVDVYFLMQQRPLEHWLDRSSDKFRDVRDFRALAFRALVYFDDADAEKLPMMVEPVDWQRVKDVLRKEVNRVARHYYDLGDL